MDGAQHEHVVLVRAAGREVLRGGRRLQRQGGEERAALAAIGPPFLASWGDDVVAVVLDDDTDWAEVGELVTESYRLLAPNRLVRELDAGG